jgi:hypothetical protein
LHKYNNCGVTGAKNHPPGQRQTGRKISEALVQSGVSRTFFKANPSSRLAAEFGAFHIDNMLYSCHIPPWLKAR